MNCFIRRPSRIFYIIILGIFLFKDSFSDTCPYNDILSFAVGDPINLNTTLQQVIYGYTNKINCRDVLTQPITMYNNNTFPYQRNFTFNFFYLGAPGGVYFNKNGKEINTVLTIGDLSSQVNDIFEQMFSDKAFQASNFPLIGDLFDDILIKQHRIGGVFQGGFEIGKNFLIYAQIPLVYQINHPHAYPEAQDKISDELEILMNPNREVSTLNPAEPGLPDQNNSPTSFIRENCVADFFGIDRSIFGVVYKDAFCSECSLELRLFFPGTEFIYGVIGADNTFTARKNVNFSLISFLNDFIKESGNFPACTSYDPIKGSNSFKNVFGQMLSRITDATYNIPFSSKSYAISPSIIYSYGIGDGFYVDLYGTFIYEFSKDAYRYGYIKPNFLFEDLTVDQASAMPPDEAYAVLNVFSNDFNERILLQPFWANVIPGYQLQGNFSIVTMVSDISTRAGIDFWYQSREKVFPICVNNNNSSLSTNQKTFNNIIFTQKDEAYQTQVFSQIEYIWDRCGVLWSFGARINATVFNSGIAGEYGLALMLEGNF